MEESSKSFGRSAYITLAIVSFIFFFLVSFPWGILKEAVVAQIRGVSPISVQIGQLGPSLPFGFQADDIKLSSADGSKEVELRHVEVTISFLSLFIGDLGLSLDIVDKTGGELTLNTDIPLSQILGGQPLPSSIDLNSDKFSIGDLVSLGLNVYSDYADELVKGLIKQIDLRGKLLVSLI